MSRPCVVHLIYTTFIVGYKLMQNLKKEKQNCYIFWSRNNDIDLSKKKNIKRNTRKHLGILKSIYIPFE